MIRRLSDIHGWFAFTLGFWKWPYSVKNIVHLRLVEPAGAQGQKVRMANELQAVKRERD